MAKRKKVKGAKKAANSSRHSLRPEVERMPLMSWSAFFQKWPIPLVLALVAIALYAMTWQFGYILDDKIVLSENDFVKKGFAGIWDILSTESFTGYFGKQQDLVAGGRYRPLSLLTFAIEYQVFGLKPSISHLINTLLLGWTAILVAYTSCLLWPKWAEVRWYWHIGFWAGLFFAVHPIHTEVVANIKGRDEILALIFALHALIAAFKGRSWTSLLLSGLFLYLGLLAKENALTFLAVIPVFIYYFAQSGAKDLRNYLVKVLVVLGAVSVLYLLQRAAVLGFFLSSGTKVTELLNDPFVEMMPHEKYATILHTLLEYLRLLVWPHPLSHDYYPYAISIKQFTDISVIAASLVHIGLAAFAIFSLKKKSAYGAMIWFYLATLSIVSNIPFSVGTFMNERFIYMPSVAFAWMLGFFLMKRMPGLLSKRRMLPLALAGVLALIGAVLTIQRLPVWGDVLELNRSAVEARPGSARSQMFYGTALYNKALEFGTQSQERKGHLKRAMQHLLTSIDIHPSYSNAHKMRSGVAAKLFEEDRDIEALLSHFMEVVKAKPQTAYVYEFLNYMHRQGAYRDRLIRFYVEAGYKELANRQNKPRLAMKMLQQGLTLAPNNPDLRSAIAEVYTRAGMQEEAAKYR